MTDKQDPQRSAHRRRLVAAVIAVPILLILVITVIKMVRNHGERRAREAQVSAGPTTRVVTVQPPQQKQILTLIGEARPYDSVTLYAKVSGYLRSVKADKGDRVHEGQLLAVIDSPEIAEEYAGASADARNKRSIAERTRPLLARQLVSQQEADQIFADADIAESRAKSLAAQKEYAEIRAPFDGVVTARFADPGALVQNATNSQASALPVFAVSRFDRLRVDVYVDQRDAAYVRVGQPVMISMSERPNLHVTGQIARAAGELDPKTRMMLAEVDLDNRQLNLVAGSYLQVAVELPAPPYPVVPVEALVYRTEKLFVPVVSDSGTVHFTEVGVADNDGQRAQIFSGLKGGERVALNLGNSVEEGSHIQEAPAETKTAAPSQATAPQAPGPQPTGLGTAQSLSSPAYGTAPDLNTNTAVKAPADRKPIGGSHQ